MRKKALKAVFENFHLKQVQLNFYQEKRISITLNILFL